MEIYQLKTFVAVAREGSITRASERLFISQPAISAHIKAIEETLGLLLFARTPQGMRLTRDGEQLLINAEQTLLAHHELLEAATRLKGQLSGKFRLGMAHNSDPKTLGRLLITLAERYPEVEVTLHHGPSLDILDGVRSGHLDAGFYNGVGMPDPELLSTVVAEFGIYLAAPLGLVPGDYPLDWPNLATFPWIYPTTSSCCGQTAEDLFQLHQIRPKRVISIDRESVTRTLIAGGVGIGLLHTDTAKAALVAGEVELLYKTPSQVQVIFAYRADRAQDSLLKAICSLINLED